MRGARVDARHAGKVAGPGGLLVITWEHGGMLLDTGFRADDRTTHAVWARPWTISSAPRAHAPEETP